MGQTTMKLRKWELLLLIAVAVILLSGAVLEQEAQALSQQFVRLHVIANSDSQDDQTMKLAVRDAILSYAEQILPSGLSMEETQAALAAQLDTLESIGEQAVRAYGADYSVAVSLTDAHFPTKVYEDFSLPAGTYRALRVVIGDGAGENWWCVVFPPLCLGAVSEDAATEAMAYGVDEESARLITGENEGYILKFKCLEWWDNLTEEFK